MGLKFTSLACIGLASEEISVQSLGKIFRMHFVGCSGMASGSMLLRLLGSSRPVASHDFLWSAMQWWP